MRAAGFWVNEYLLVIDEPKKNDTQQPRDDPISL